MTDPYEHASEEEAMASLSQEIRIRYAEIEKQVEYLAMLSREMLTLLQRVEHDNCMRWCKTFDTAMRLGPNRVQRRHGPPGSGQMPPPFSVY